ncbi:unnamed protein product [Rodentolepis nana]|uniref:Reverse transcriptase domain-containing protein n=1 Tax=Rodentolepis nana TaxID=102285 RepID=A0A0R3TRA1_RODNA|nr:unnamed protein product [Rodentolepis nana]
MNGGAKTLIAVPDENAPISLTSVLAKLMERMVSKRLTWFLETNDILMSEQASFMPQRSTNQQVSTFSQHIEDALDARNTLTAGVADFKSAYDLVWKEKLILKLAKIVDNNDEASVSILFSHNCNLENYDNDGLTPLTLAVEKNNIQMVHYFVAHGSVVYKYVELPELPPLAYAAFFNWLSPLETAIMGRNDHMVSYLLSNNVSVSDPNRHGFTPLITSIIYDNASAAALLLCYGADPDALVTGYRTTGEQVAMDMRRKEIAQIIFFCGNMSSCRHFLDGDRICFPYFNKSLTWCFAKQSCPVRSLNSAKASILGQSAMSESATVHCFSFVRALISLHLEVWNSLLIKVFIVWKDIGQSMHCKIVVPFSATLDVRDCLYQFGYVIDEDIEKSAACDSSLSTLKRVQVVTAPCGKKSAACDSSLWKACMQLVTAPCGRPVCKTLGQLPVEGLFVKDWIL